MPPITTPRSNPTKKHSHFRLVNPQIFLLITDFSFLLATYDYLSFNAPAPKEASPPRPVAGARRLALRQASDALTITEAAFFQMSAVIHDS